jgi:hypothetical protein
MKERQWPRILEELPFLSHRESNFEDEDSEKSYLEVCHGSDRAAHHNKIRADPHRSDDHGPWCPEFVATD